MTTVLRVGTAGPRDRVGQLAPAPDRQGQPRQAAALEARHRQQVRTPPELLRPVPLEAQVNPQALLVLQLQIPQLRGPPEVPQPLGILGRGVNEGGFHG